MHARHFLVLVVCSLSVGIGCQPKPTTNNSSPPTASTQPSVPPPANQPSANAPAAAAGNQDKSPNSTYPPGAPPADALPVEVSRALDEQYEGIKGKIDRGSEFTEWAAMIDGKRVKTMTAGTITIREDLSIAGHSIPKSTRLTKKDSWWVVVK